MKYNIYYNTTTNHLIKSNVTKQEVREWLKGISLVERSNCVIEEVEEKEIIEELDR